MAKWLMVAISAAFIGSSLWGSTTVAAVYEHGCIVSEAQMASGYNAPARYDVTGEWDFFLTAAFIYWQPREKGLDISVPYECTTGARVLNMRFDFKPGFKVGLGVNFNHDNWNLFAEYTWLCMDEHRSRDDAPSSGTWNPNWLYNDAGAFTTAYGKWSLHTHIVDLPIGRPEYVGKALIFWPFAAMRFFIIDQKYQAVYNTYGSNTKSDSWGVGPRIGLKTSWLLTDGFRIYCNSAACLAYQYFKTNYLSYHGATTDRYVKDRVGYLTPNYDLGMGFGWGTYFFGNSCHFDMTLGYDVSYFWNQNMMRFLHDNEFIKIDSSAGNLMLHGGTLNFRLDF